MRNRVSRRVAQSEPERVQVRRWMAWSWRSEGAGEQRLCQYPATEASVTGLERHGQRPVQKGWHRSHLSPWTEGLFFYSRKHGGHGFPLGLRRVRSI